MGEELTKLASARKESDATLKAWREKTAQEYFRTVMMALGGGGWDTLSDRSSAPVIPGTESGGGWKFSPPLKSNWSDTLKLTYGLFLLKGKDHEVFQRD